MADPTFIHQLKNQLDRPLPGRAAQYKMAHVGRQQAVDAPPHAKRAAVMALFYPRGGAWHLVLIERRSDNPKDRHGGQMGFPGGRYEEQDADLGQTALRETEEEIGVNRESIQLLGKLSRLYIPVSNFLVHPFVGHLDHSPQFRPQASEVKAIVQVSLSQLVAPHAVGTTTIRISKGITLNHVPFFDLEGKVVWGATAMMLSELLEIIRRDVGDTKVLHPNL